jgi:hypothetical protein
MFFMQEIGFQFEVYVYILTVNILYTHLIWNRQYKELLFQESTL